MISEWIVLAGALLYLIAVFGILRLPDIYQRMHAATKAGSAAISLVLLGFMFHEADFAAAARASAAIVFLFLTLPLASFLLGRAAVQSQAPTSDDTRKE